MKSPVESAEPIESSGNAPESYGALPAEVFQAELEEIAQRNPHIAKRAGERAGRPSTELGLVGLAFSGGGIRSATFNLGVMQALHRHGVLQRADYLSTVSGGGYIGSCLQTLLADGRGFPFEHRPGVPEGAALRHLRSYSNYLLPRGLMDLAAFPVLVLRGLVTNFLILLPILLLAVFAVTLIWGNAIADAYIAGSGKALWQDGFVITRIAVPLSLLGIALYPVAAYFLASIGRSTWGRRNSMLRLAGGILIALIAVALFEVQPIAIYWFGYLSEAVSTQLCLLTGGKSCDAQAAVSTLADLPGMIGAAVGLLLSLFTALSARIGAQLRSRLRFALVGIVGPLALWLIFLALARRATMGLPFEYFTGSGPLGGPLRWLAGWNGWMLTVGELMGSNIAFLRAAHPELIGYFYGAVVLWLLDVWFIDVNKSSLHPYYRDRLSRAYLVQRRTPRPSILSRVKHGIVQRLPSAVRKRMGADADGDEPATEPDEVLVHVDTFALGALDSARAPYHLINAAINVPATRHPKLRGRKADFFLISKRYLGSSVTNYCRTGPLQRKHPELNLGTALAISGAAAAPNMGTATIGSLRMVMALLNVRLGYWLPNPGSLSWITKVLPAGPTFLFREMLGWIHERAKQVNVSDGGHIENLGIYELFRRRCRVIIACDAEADPEMKFQGLATAIRLARIDMGVDVDIHLDDLRLPEPKSCESKEDHSSGYSRRHCAVGSIDYGGGDEGVLVYIKSSMTGDENPYITEYRQRSLQGGGDPFPHQTTADQFFDESQFEAYRALGYHAASELFRPTSGEPGLPDNATPAAAWFGELGPERGGPESAAEPVAGARPAVQ